MAQLLIDSVRDKHGGKLLAGDNNADAGKVVERYKEEKKVADGLMAGSLEDGHERENNL